MKSVSFYHLNINPALVQAQKSVFDHFGMEHEQVLTELNHGEAIDHWLLNNEWDKIAIFDIDCIPLHDGVLQNASKQIGIYKRIIYGAAQKANHLPDLEIYCSPAFCCFNQWLYYLMGRPSFVDIPGNDIGTYFSDQMRMHGEIMLLYPSHIEVPLWDLREGEKFGLGTTYGTEVYHAFQSRMNNGSTDRFIKKCQEVING